MIEQWNEKAVFLEVLALAETDREGYLQSACPDVESLRRIRELLDHHRQAEGHFLEPAELRPSTGDETLELVDEFRIIKRIGEGGMGVVYLAKDSVLGRQIALKVLANHLAGSRDALARFVAEARSAAALKHPGIVPVHKFGFDGRHHYIASEFIDGPTLAEVIAAEVESRTAISRTRHLRESYRRAATFAAMIADALEAAHRAGIVHRDVKPSNILIDIDGNARLTDFGIAKQLDEVTLQTVAIGSCHYMSPEQAATEVASIDQRSDLFSLGVVLYEMVALRRPFDGPDVARVLKAIATQDPVQLRSVDSHVPKDLETICHKALEKKPDHRYQTAGHMAADLRCFLDSRPILARPPSALRRTTHWVRVHRRAVVFAVFMVLLATVASFAIFENQRRHAQWIAARCSVTLIADRSDLQVYAIPFEDQTYLPGTPEELGSVADGSFHILPGQYRFEVVAADGSFAEVEYFFDDAGESVALPVKVEQQAVSAPVDMVLVPEGEYVVGRENGNPFESKRTVSIQAFWLDKHEVSNADFRAFTIATGHASPPQWEVGYDPELADRPVVGITWNEMQAYARWVGKRLPTFVEWECAARYPDGRLYPWGNVPDRGLVDLTHSQSDDIALADWQYAYRVYVALVQPVESHPELISALGLYHMFGNVAEFTASLMPDQQNTVLVKGTSYARSTAAADLSRNSSWLRDVRSFQAGFRCARSTRPLLLATKEY